MGKIRVEELAQQMGLPSKEVLFLLQSIGVDVKSAQAALDETTVLAILQGRTHAPKQLIVRDTESRAVRPQKSALNRIKIIDRPLSSGGDASEAPTSPQGASEPETPAPKKVAEAAETRETRTSVKAAAEPARTAVVPSEPEAEAPAPKPAPAPVPRKIVLPPRPAASPRPAAPAAGPGAARPAGPLQRPMGPSGGMSRPMGPAGGVSRPMGPASGPGRPMGRPAGPSVYRPSPGGPGARPLGGPPRPGAPVGRTAPAGPERGAAKRKKDSEDEKKKAAAGKRGARPKITVADEVDLREFVGTYQEDTYSDISLPLIEKTGEETEAPAEPRPASKSAIRRAAKETRAHDSGKLLEFRKPAPTGPVFFTEGVTVKELSEKIGVLARDIQRLLMQRGVLATVNQTLDATTAVQIAKEIGVEAAVVSFEEELDLSRSARESSDGGATAERVPRAPVVTVMGHVDHGKTSLLDAIRQTNVAAGEAGGITQHIGAYRVEVHGKPIVFLDTPGHEAFTSMRARGAKATDIVVLVVAADDAVMPQTIEAIDHARAAKVPIVVAINKIDKPNANVDRVKKELADQNVLLEAWGGDTPSAEISAVKKEGIDHLLELILLVAEMQELTAPAGGAARGVVLEARREAGRGNVATVLVQAGTLKVGDVFFAGSVFGRVRSMQDDRGEKIAEAGPATPVEVTGLRGPAPGRATPSRSSKTRPRRARSSPSASRRSGRRSWPRASQLSLDQLFSKIQEGKIKDLPIILKTDVSGSMEVLSQSLEEALERQGEGLAAARGRRRGHHQRRAARLGVRRDHRRLQRSAREEGRRGGREGGRRDPPPHRHLQRHRRDQEGHGGPARSDAEGGRPRPRRGAQHLQGAEVRRRRRLLRHGGHDPAQRPASASCATTASSTRARSGRCAASRTTCRRSSRASSAASGSTGYQDVKVGDVIEAFQVEKVAGVMGVSRLPEAGSRTCFRLPADGSFSMVIAYALFDLHLPGLPRPEGKADDRQEPEDAHPQPSSRSRRRRSATRTCSSARASASRRSAASSRRSTRCSSTCSRFVEENLDGEILDYRNEFIHVGRADEERIPPQPARRRRRPGGALAPASCSRPTIPIFAASRSPTSRCRPI